MGLLTEMDTPMYFTIAHFRVSTFSYLIDSYLGDEPRLWTGPETRRQVLTGD